MSKFYQAKHAWHNCGYVFEENGEYIYIRHPLTGWEQQVWIPAIATMYVELTMEQVADLHRGWP